MSEKTFLEGLHRKLEDLDAQLRELNARRSVLTEVIADYQAENGPHPVPTLGGGAPAIGTSKRRGRKPRSSGGMTVKDAILKVVGEATEPLTPAQIIPAVVQLSKGAEGSIRSQLSPMAKQGFLKQIEHEGRGFKYALCSTSGSSANQTATQAEDAPRRASKGRKHGSGRKKADSADSPSEMTEIDPQVDPIPPA
jgi:hypothetical protein